MTTDNKPTIEKTFARYKEYKLQFPYQNGSKVITDIKIEVPSGLQVIAMGKVADGNGSELEMLATLLSQCSDCGLTTNQFLEFKYPDLKALTEVCSDFLQ
jgi:hypothetical protein